MSDGSDKDWNPGTYERFRDLRLRPAHDLLAQVPELTAPGAVIDLGCGTGAVAASLAARFAARPLVGVDASPAMLTAAQATGHYSDLAEADIALWQPEAAPALIFSNAALHWLPDHEALMSRLAQALAPGGALAVQMPRQFDAPSHRLLREIAADMFADRFDFAAWLPPVATPEDYARLLAPLGEINVWETTYVQRLAPAGAEHPVRRFTESTAMRPFLSELDAAEAGRFASAYEAELAAHYPAEEGGAVHFPFTRLFFTLTRP